MKARYWAVRPTSMPDHIRFEKADTPIQACILAFGRSAPLGSKMAKYDVGKWQVKDFGSRVAVLQNDKKRCAMLADASGWLDPYANGKEKS